MFEVKILVHTGSIDCSYKRYDYNTSIQFVSEGLLINDGKGFENFT